MKYFIFKTLSATKIKQAGKLYLLYIISILESHCLVCSKFTSTLRPKDESKWGQFSSSVEWWWMLRIAPNLNRILAIIFSIVSVCIIWSELVFNVRRPAIISIVYYALNACGNNYAALEVFT